MSTKEKFALYLEPDTREEIDYWYEADNCASRTEFIEKAVKFYLSYLRIGDDSALLPKAVLSAIEGQLGEFQTHFSRLMFKQTVELSMMMNLIAGDTDLDDVALSKLRGRCVAEVKRTNGQLTFKEIILQQEMV